MAYKFGVCIPNTILLINYKFSNHDILQVTRYICHAFFKNNYSTYIHIYHEYVKSSTYLDLRLYVTLKFKFLTFKWVLCSYMVCLPPHAYMYGGWSYVCFHEEGAWVPEVQLKNETLNIKYMNMNTTCGLVQLILSLLNWIAISVFIYLFLFEVSSYLFETLFNLAVILQVDVVQNIV